MSSVNLPPREKPRKLSAINVLIAAPVDPQPRTRIRQRIKRLLEDRGMTQRAFGIAVGHGDQWVSNLLGGDFTLTMDDLDIVAKALRVPPGEIVRVSDEPWELTPTEMRVIRALRMLPPPVRDDYAKYADWLIGVVPDEAPLLDGIRALNEENKKTVQRWVDALRRAQARELDEVGLDALLREVEPPAAPKRRNRQDQKHGKAGKR